jgi:hypothetical protein
MNIMTKMNGPLSLMIIVSNISQQQDRITAKSVIVEESLSTGIIFDIVYRVEYLGIFLFEY